ncbi:MAG: type II secretion system GspH family protein [Proteobacteria bacterium]|nr:type II secretion system GspH family protein [Pseudomonadota bacterium]
MKSYGNTSGFTLVEMAMVMVIVALLLGGLMMSLSQTTENTRRSDAKAQMDGIIDALYGYAQANGRLPCPATPASNGAELPVGGGVCSRQHGFVPSATLGLSGAVNADGLLLDPWNAPYRYSVTTANASAFTKAGAGGMQATTMTVLAPDLRVCREAACSNIVSATLPVVVVSIGKNWAAFTSAGEVANAGEATVGGGPSGVVYRIANNRDFVSTTYHQANFDDLITWLSPHILYTKMIAAGKLP